MSDVDDDDAERRELEMDLVRSMYAVEKVVCLDGAGKEGASWSVCVPVTAVGSGDEDGEKTDVLFEFKMPDRYPSREKLIVNRVEWKRATVPETLSLRDALDGVCERLLKQGGEESVYACILKLSEAVAESLLEREVAGICDPRGTREAAEDADPVLMQRLIYFHHILAKKKKVAIRQWADELNIGGLWKVGYPGVILCEGEEGDTGEFIRRLRSLPWKSMTLKAESSATVSNIDESRLLPGRLELMDDLASLRLGARSSGIEDDLF